MYRSDCSFAMYYIIGDGPASEKIVSMHFALL